MKRLFILISSLLFIVGLSAQDNVVKNSYHNVTAHYNGYWIANERIIEIEKSILDKHDWDFNRMLPLFPQFDTTTSKALEDPILDCIEKASIAIQRHPESRWEDDAYILVGKARLYGSEFPEAIETFKYVNTNGELKKDRHNALIQLMRTFVEAQEMDNAQAVSDFINDAELSEEALTELSIIRAYYFQKTNRIPEMADHLKTAVLRLSGDEREPRLAFTLGQALQSIGDDSAAYIYYKRCIRRSKDYDLSFYARLNMSQVSQASAKASDKEIRRYFKNLLKDPKNEEYKGRIYYELGNYNAKNDEIDQAIESYKTSIAENNNDNRLKGYTYLKLAEIYYDRLNDYSLAKAYYDSTASSYPQDEAGYKKIQLRAEVLTDFVKYYETIQRNDSLLSLATLPPDSVNGWLEMIIRQRESSALAEAEKKKKQEKRSAIFETTQQAANDRLVDIKVETEGTWYFYNTSELNRGFTAFRTTWGQRTLEDNWRRSFKSGGSDNPVETSNAEISTRRSQGQETGNSEEVEPVFDAEAEMSALLATIPFEQEAQISMLEEIEEASYQLGKLYNFQLQEKENAIQTFEGFTIRFDRSRYIPEVLYQLFLLYKNKDSLKSAMYFDQLTIRHDTSVFAKLAVNPNYLNERDQEEEQFKKIYVRAFDLYKKGQPKASQQLIDSALFSKPQNEYVDNLHLLSAMNQGELEGIYKYQFELNNFITRYRESDLVPYAEKLLKTSQEFQINLYTSSKARFIQNFDITHYFILVYPNQQELTSKVPGAMDDYLETANYSLVSGNIVLDEEHAVLLVNEFNNKPEAESFFLDYVANEQISSKFAPARFIPMVITTENFQIFYETKDLDTYKTFFSKHYKND